MKLPARLNTLVATYQTRMAEWLEYTDDGSRSWKELEAKRTAAEDAAIDVADYLVGVIQSQRKARGA